MTLVFVPAGEFTMGSDTSGELNEQPAHQVELDAFWIDQTEITNKMYALCVKDGVCSIPAALSSSTHSAYYGNPDFGNYPVIRVDWNMAKTYCEWAGRDLPTEAQWEKAARGEESLTYPWGDESPNSRLLNNNSIFEDTTIVGKFLGGKSVYKVYDMAGNVREWVKDWYGENYYKSLPTIVLNPVGPDSGDSRVLKGGSWNYNDENVRSAIRSKAHPSDPYDNVGFRCLKLP